MLNSQQKNGLVWKDEYSVNVKEIDDQHKQLFAIVNNLINVVDTIPDEEIIRGLVSDLIAYKKAHFATEEKYFEEFHFEGKIDHQAAHTNFDQNVNKLQEQYQNDATRLARELIDYLEDWFIGHIIYTDHAYTKCFNDHGLH